MPSDIMKEVCGRKHRKDIYDSRPRQEKTQANTGNNILKVAKTISYIHCKVGCDIFSVFCQSGQSSMTAANHLICII